MNPLKSLQVDTGVNLYDKRVGISNVHYHYAVIATEGNGKKDWRSDRTEDLAGC